MQITDEIYQNYVAEVNRYLLSLTHDSDLAEELTQETFYQAIRSIERFEGKSSLYTWLCGIAKNCFNAYRKKHPQTVNLNEPLSVTFSASPEEEALSAEKRLELIKSLHGIPEPQREIIYLHVFCELSFSEIGEIFGKTDNWARVNFFRGKNKLKKEANKDA